MFENVLVPTDFSNYSQRVLECLIDIRGAKDVVLVHVIGHREQATEAKVKLAEQEKFLESHGLNVKARFEILTEEGISATIQKIADEENVSLIIMGARGKSIVEGIFLGNVAKNLLRYGNTNLLLLRYNILEGREGPTLEKICPQLFSKVLCPMDFSKPATQALSFVKRIEGVKEIVLQHVVVRGETWEEINASKEEADKKLKALGDDILGAGMKFKALTSVGYPANEISDLARKEDVSLIAMSSHGKDWRMQLTIGSTTYDVTRMADRPVLVVKAIQMP